MTLEKYRGLENQGQRDNIFAESEKIAEAVGNVYVDDQTVDVLHRSEGFAALDAKLLGSPANCAEGDLGRQIATFKHPWACENKPMKGWFGYQH